MTRFARSKGSKASNEKTPEEATPWSKLRPQQNSSEVSTSNVKSASELLADHINLDTIDEKADWALLENDISSPNVTMCAPVKVKKRKNTNSESKTEFGLEFENKKVKKSKKHVESEVNGEPSTLETVKSKKRRKLPFSNELPESLPDLVQQSVASQTKNKKGKERSKKSGEKSNAELGPSNSTSEVMMKKKKRENKSGKQEESKFKKSDMKQVISFTKPETNAPRIKQRRKPELESQTLNINGENVTIVPFDGFYVTQSDAERLKQLRTEMRKNKIPKKQIFLAIKLERRKAEKALARLKKKVCFHCRKAGHNLSECPEIGESQTTASGICYKCGSLEHAYFECKVTQGQEFRFAECFICKEQGHIARQCPDNPRGLYPKGGGCNICGDVTHLKKDCPQLQAQKAEETLTVGVSGKKNASVEGLDEDAAWQKPVKKAVKTQKHIKF